MPEEAIGSKIAEEFAKFETIENLKICLLRAEVANSDLPKALEELGAIVDDVACYKTVPENRRSHGNRRESSAGWGGLDLVYQRFDC
jgi:uroporphyrinogen-III synthase